MSTRGVIAAAAGAAMLAVFAYSNTVGHGFVWDDRMLIVENPLLTSFSALLDAFRGSFWQATFEQLDATDPQPPYFRPLVHIFFFICRSVGGVKPFGFHVGIIAVHALCSALVAWVTFRLTPNALAAFVAGGLFAVHPIHTESVAWISGISDVGMTTFLLAALVCVTGAVPLSVGRVVAAAFLALCSALTKEPGVFAFVLPVAVCWFVPSVKRSREEVQRLGAAMSVAFVVWFVLRQQAIGAVPSHLNHTEMGFGGWVLAGLTLLHQAFSSLLAPVELNALHVLEPVPGVTLAVVLGVLVAVGTPVAAVMMYRRAPAVSFGVATMFLALLPGTLVPFLPLNAFAERFVYLPSAGFCIALGAAVALMHERSARLAWVLAAGFVVVMAAGIAATHMRNRVWANNLALFLDVETKSKPVTLVLNNLGSALLQANHVTDAIVTLKKVKQPNVTTLMELSVAYARSDDPEMGLQTLSKVLAMHPNHGMAWTNRCLMLQRMRRFEDAVKSCERALQLVPNLAQAHAIAARAYIGAGRRDDAIREAEKAYELDPNNEPAKEMYRQMHGEAGR